MNKAQETKIELLTECIETFVLASIVITMDGNPKRKPQNHQNLLDARETLKTSLREFMAPSLRVVAASETVRKVGGISLTERTTKSELAEIVPYDGMGIEGMNLA